MDNGASMDPNRLATYIFESISALSSGAAYAAVFGVLLICGLGVPIPEDITLLVAGVLTTTGHFSLPGALAAGFFGVLVGDAVLFFMGRRFGSRIFGLPGFRRFLTPERIAKAEDRVRRNGHFICFVARFLPGLRAPIFAIAGAMGVRPAVFILQDGFAALISVPVWIYLGHWVGNNWDEGMRYVKRLQGGIFIGVAVLVVGYLVYRYMKKRQRVAVE